MKLSQKLLGLAGVALADYACCPYDDYGLPDSACTAQLREKTPFAGSDFQKNDCKAWEFNADATFDGNDLCGNDYGQCGYQRQFAWGAANTAVQDPSTAYTNALGIASDWSLSFGSSGTLLGDAQFDTDAATKATPNTFSGDVASPDSRNKANGWGIGQAPKLGAMCKLFVPVSPANIVQVQIAGVHKMGGPIASSAAMFPAQFKPTAAATAVDGTVYCFSVVNPAEGDLNSNGVANGNVNGKATAGLLAQGDDFASSTSLQRQAGLGVNVDWNGYLTGTPDAAVTLDSSNDENNDRGANFDVVAHFKSSWCSRGAVGTPGKIVEMQQAGDANFNDNDYDITSNHAHNDIIEKRFGSNPYALAYTAVDANGYMTNAAGTTGLRWPNMGAWAGFHSVVTCAVTSSAAGNNAWTGDDDLMMSVASNDFRQGAADCSGMKYRFNVRQIGDNIANCGPGQLLDTDQKRCTWNWNYVQTPGTPANDDPEDFFDRTDNMVFDTWADGLTGRKRRTVGAGAAVSHDNAEPNTLAAYGPTVNNKVLTFAFNTYLGAAKAVTIVPDASKYWTSITATASATPSATLQCLTSAGPFRDNFPDCFFGDEVHFTADYTGSTDPMDRISPWLSTVTIA